MSRASLILSLLTLSGVAFAQSNVGKCGVEIHDVSSITAFGYLSAYTVMFRNTNEKSVDGIYYTAVFYNNEDREIERKEDAFNSSAVINPIASGVVRSLVRSPGVKGASKLVIVVNRVHFTNGKTCK